MILYKLIVLANVFKLKQRQQQKRIIDNKRKHTKTIKDIFD